MAEYQGQQPAQAGAHQASLPLLDLARGQRELREQMALLQLWLQDLRDRGSVVRSEAAGVLERPTVDGSCVVPVYSLSVDGFFSAQHSVTITGKEGSLHAHSWRVNVKLSRESLGDEHVMLGFAEIKQALRKELALYDGKTLNNLPFFADVPPTSENVAAVIYAHLKDVARDLDARLDSVTVWESPTNAVTYVEVVH